MYRDVCDAKLAWDVGLSSTHLAKWHQEPVCIHFELHSFGVASTKGVGAAVYAVVKQPSGTTQQLVAAKSRLAKRNLSVPQLELVAAHVATNLLENVCSALPKKLQPTKFACVDSTIALHWIVGKGSCRQFVANRVAKIQAHPSICWRHVPTKDNPTDIAKRGGLVNSFWWSGPEWL